MRALVRRHLVHRREEHDDGAGSDRIYIVYSVGSQLKSFRKRYRLHRDLARVLRAHLMGHGSTMASW